MGKQLGGHHMTKTKELHLQVVRLDANQNPQVLTIPNNLKTFQNIVGGLIEVVEICDVLCIINEEGKLLDLDPNFAFPISVHEGKRYFDIIAGDCFFVGDDGENFRSLTDDEVIQAVTIASEGRRVLEFLKWRRQMEG
jgi:hypothetical protein